MPVAPLVANYSNVINACGSDTESAIQDLINASKTNSREHKPAGDLRSITYLSEGLLGALVNFITPNVSINNEIFLKTRKKNMPFKPINLINDYFLSKRLYITIPFYHKTFIQKQTTRKITYTYRAIPQLAPRWWGQNSRYKPLFGELKHFNPASEKVWVQVPGSPPKIFVYDLVYLSYNDQDYIKKNLQLIPDDGCEYVFDPKKPQNEEFTSTNNEEFTISGNVRMTILYRINMDILNEMFNTFMASEWKMNFYAGYNQVFNPNDSIYADYNTRLNPRSLMYDVIKEKAGGPLNIRNAQNQNPYDYFFQLCNQYLDDPRFITHSVTNSSKLDVIYDKNHSHDDYFFWKKRVLDLRPTDSIIKGAITSTDVDTQLFDTNYTKTCKDDCGRITETSGRGYIERIIEEQIKVLDYKEDPKNKYGIKCKELKSERVS